MKKFKVVFASDIHYPGYGYFCKTGEEFAESLCADLAEEYANAPYDALLLLGDYSLDHWGSHAKGSYINHGISYTKLFAERYLHRIAPEGVSVRMIAGNHEQFSEALWHELTGYHRNDHIVIGDILFILTDTWNADLDPVEHSDGRYSGTNVAEISELMARYPDKKVILCAHSFNMAAESQEFCELLRKEDRIVCLICGHYHKSCIMNTGEENGNKPIIYTGHYSFSLEPNNILCLPGYRVLEFDEEGLSSKYVVPPHTYQLSKVKFHTEYAEQDTITLKF